MSDDKRIKQVIVMRHDLKMRRGKQIAQGAHASMSFLCRRLQERGSVSLNSLTDAQREWPTGSFAKVCCRVDSEEELMQIHDKAVAGRTGNASDHGQRQDGIPRPADPDMPRYRSRRSRQD